MHSPCHVLWKHEPTARDATDRRPSRGMARYLAHHLAVRPGFFDRPDRSLRSGGVESGHRRLDHIPLKGQFVRTPYGAPFTLGPKTELVVLFGEMKDRHAELLETIGVFFHVETEAVQALHQL